MCVNCWIERGSPKIINEMTKALQPLIDDVYEHHGAGGGLHIILDDFNVEDGHVTFCQDWIEHERGNGVWKTDPVSPEQLKAERECLKLLKAMTVEERASAIAFHDGFFTV
jgi:hypothetical protein